MNGFEQVALGGICLARALRESWSPAVWRTWLPVLLARLAIVAALAGCAHPALSWAMAPLLRAASAEDALRFPQLFQRLASLAARGDLPVLLLIVPLCAGSATRSFAEAFGAPAPASHRMLREASALVLVSLPALIAGVAVQVALERLAGVRLSGFSRAVLPHLGLLLVLTVQAACFYLIAEIVLGGSGAPGALAAIPRSLAAGFVPALVVLALLELPMLAFAPIEPLAASGRWHGMPEAAVVVACVRAAVQTLTGLLAAGAGTLAWMSAVAPAEDGP